MAADFQPKTKQKAELKFIFSTTILSRIIWIRLEQQYYEVDYHADADKSARENVKNPEQYSSFVKLMRSEHAEKQTEKERYPLTFWHIYTSFNLNNILFAIIL